MKNKNKIICVFLLSLFILSVFASSVIAQENWWAHSPKNGKQYVIGYNPRARLSPVWSILLLQAQKTATELGIDLRVLDIESESDAIGQATVIEDFITQDVDFIITCPVDQKAFMGSLIKAQDAKIPLGQVLEIGATPGINTAFWIGTNDYIGSVKLADAAAQFMNYKANVIFLQGVIGQYGSETRQRAFEDTFKLYPNIKIIAKSPANWEREKGTKVMEDLMVQFGDQTDLIMAFNEEMGIGAARAYEAAGKKCPPIFSYNGHLEALTKTKDGVLTMTVDMNWASIGEAMIRQALAILKGEKPMGERIDIPVNLVNPGNIDFFIKKLVDLGIK